VASHADEARESLRARLDQRLERAARTERDLLFLGLDQVVQLDQVDAVDAHALERTLELGARTRGRALRRLGRQEEPAAVGSKPGR
jgi:hypothetical protein